MKPYHNHNYNTYNNYENNYNNDIDSEYYNEEIENEEEYYPNNRNINNRIHHGNDILRRNGNLNNNIMYNTLNNMNLRNNRNDYYDRRINKENLYKKNLTPRKRLSIYTQTEPFPTRNNYINEREKNRYYSVENNYEGRKRYDYYGNRDNSRNISKTHKFLRFNTNGSNRPIDMLLEND